MKTPTTILEICERMAKVFDECDDPRKVAACAVKTAAAGKIISAVGMDLLHMKMRKEVPNHPWCMKGESPKLVTVEAQKIA